MSEKPPLTTEPGTPVIGVSEKMVSRVGKRTDLFLRFSTVAGFKGFADTARDPRG